MDWQQKKAASLCAPLYASRTAVLWWMVMIDAYKDEFFFRCCLLVVVHHYVNEIGGIEMREDTRERETMERETA
ncbi:hypothetical protein GCK32_004454 [Trichostrongylus colubriformis]|uniref:Uncharacterized protein n=1 Tax=Trichostrongylus colubriformis TaxID=6319 RepID=A0AAN8FA95_TRICO